MANLWRNGSKRAAPPGIAASIAWRGADLVADHRQHEGADALGRRVAAQIKGGSAASAPAVPAHRQAQGQPAAGLVRALPSNRQPVVGLGQRRVAGQITGQAAVGADGHLAARRAAVASAK